MTTHVVRAPRQARLRPTVLVTAAIWAMAAIALGFMVATRGTSVPDSWGFRGASEAFALTCGTVGAIVTLRRPDNLNGWLFCAIGLFFAGQSLINEYVIAGALVVPGGLPLTTGLAWTLTWLWVPPIGIALIWLPLLFPTGALLSPRWRGVAILGAIVVVIFSLALAFIPGPIQQATFIDNPFGANMALATYSDLVLGPIWLPFGLAIALALGSLALRFRRASDEARRQIKWFALAALVAGTIFTLYLSVSIVGGSPVVAKLLEILVIFGLLGLPTAAGMAILRYRLYDIDRIVSRTIAYGLLTGIIGVLFVGSILVLRAVLAPVTGSSELAIASSTLLVAALFQPLRRRVQRVVDLRFNRARYDAERTVAAFATRLADEVDFERLRAEILGTVERTVEPTSVSLWLRP